MLLRVEGNRESAKRSRRGFLISYFSIFLQHKFGDFQLTPLSTLSPCPLFWLLSALFYLVGSLYHLTREKACKAIKPGNIFGIHLGILGK